CLRRRQRPRRRRAGGGLRRGGAGCQSRPPGAGAPVRPAAAGLHVHPAALRGSGMNRRCWQLAPRVTPRHLGAAHPSPVAPRVTPRHLGAAYPFMVEAPLSHRGVLLGQDVFGGPFVYDPWELYAEGLISNPNMLVIGEVGSGKSALKKAYVLRQAAFGRRA